MTSNFHDKTAIISGGGSGLGRALAKALLSEGARVVIASRQDSMLQASAAELNSQAPGRVLAVSCDVRAKNQVAELVRSAHTHFGSIDILINNAGLAVPNLVSECSEEDWDVVIDTNLKGTFLLSQAVLPAMTEQQSGFILNIASQAARRGYANVASYCASKFGVVGFGAALQQEVKAHGIRVHSICPGLIQTNPPDAARALEQNVLCVGDVVAAAMFILSRPAHVKLDDIGMFNLFDTQV